VGGQDARAPFYGVGRGAEWSGDGGERAAVMVCHDGAGGSHFGSESDRAVVGSDEGGVLQPFLERKGWLRKAACTRM
jgi:hypothetical protein